MTGPLDAPRPPASWLPVALDPPRAGGDPPLSGRLRERPEDFEVEELLGFAADGGAAHVMLRVRKTDANTLFVARALARFAGLRPADVGFAGLKDRRAVATQWFSVPSRLPAAAWQGFAGPGFEVLEALPHSRKIRRGALAGNRFRILLRGLAGDLATLEGGLARLAARGAPNYFGPQRFGREAGNLAAIAGWVSGGELPRDREQRAFLFSAARALAFNAVLAARVAAGSWERLLPGEVVNLDGTGSVFTATAIDPVLAQRCAELDVHPTGPLPGAPNGGPADEAGRVEAQALVGLESVVEALAAAGVEAGRRPLRVRVRDLEWRREGDALALSFSLPRGAYATAVLREIAAFDAGGLPAEGE